MSFISFVCFAASTAAAFVTAPLIEFLAALFLLFAYSTKFNERFKGFHWPLVVSFLTYKIAVLELHRASDNNICPWIPVLSFFPNHHACCFIKDFLRCVSASIIFFIISIMSVSKYVDGASKAAGVGSHQFSFISTISDNTVYFWVIHVTCDVCTGVSVFLSLSLVRSLASLPQYSSRWTFISSLMNWPTSSREVIPVKNHQTHKVSILGSYLHYLHLFALPFKSQ